MFDTYSTLVVIGAILTIISFRWHNILLSLGATLAWLVLWNYNQGNPPAGIIIGTVPHEWLMYLWIVMAIATMVVYFRQRQRNYTGFPMTKGEETELDQRRINSRPARSLMDLDNTEFRALIRSRMRRRRG